MKNFLVIGESCKDVFCYGECTRLCPEAPAPVFNPIEYKESGGMAKNVFNNILALGYDCDLVTNAAWESVIKTRYVHQPTNQLFIRVDEGESSVPRIDVSELKLDDYEIVIISDYCKGYLTEEDIRYIASRHDCVFLDTKKDLGTWCWDVNFIKINNYEFARTQHLIDDKLKPKLIITLGQKGCLYQDSLFPVETVEIKDVSGAGDTFLAGLAVKFLETGDIEKAAIFANECATQVVQKRGVSTCQK